MLKLVILDRDGVINKDSDDYIKSPDEWIPITGSLEAIARLSNNGYQVVVATNQSGLGRGLLNEYDLANIHQKLCSMVEEAGGFIAGIFYCPHTPEDACDCRKPKAGMLHTIANEFRVSLEGVPLVGDSLRDLQAGSSVGCIPILVKTGKGEKTLATMGKTQQDEQAVFNDLDEAVSWILSAKET